MTFPKPSIRFITKSFCLAAVLGTATLNSTLSAQAQSSKQKSVEALPGSTALAQLPPDAKEVAEAVKTAKAGEEIVLRGRIAMAKDVFAKDRATFTLTDDAAAAICCPKDGAIVETCSAPAEARATIQIVDASGTPLSESLENKGGLKPGAEAFVVGKVVTANGKDALVVNAIGIHVPFASMPMGFFVHQAPVAKDLSEVKKTGGLKKGDRVTVRGVIGGSATPFIDGRAMFTLMGSALKPCNANPDDHCKKPWDYCCETQSDITANSATIRVADDKGNPIRTDFKGRLRMKELSEVIVVGTVAMAKNGALIVDATQMHIIKP